MEPLFAAVMHGCAADLHEEVFGSVYYNRVIRDGQTKYLGHILGYQNIDLSILSYFFDMN